MVIILKFFERIKIIVRERNAKHDFETAGWKDSLKKNTHVSGYGIVFKFDCGRRTKIAWYIFQNANRRPGLTV